MPRTAATNRFAVRDFGTCLQFIKASSSRVSSPYQFSGLTSASAWSVSFWANIPTGEAKSALFGIKNGSSEFIIYHGETGNDGNPGLYISAGGTQIFLHDFSPDIRDGKWHHWVITYNPTGTTTTFYIDNTSLTSTGTGFSGTLSIASNVYIGGENGASLYTSARIDEFVFYDTYTLTTTDIADIYYRGIYPSATKRFWYKFDEGSGTSATDSSGNGYTGVITSATYSTDVRFKTRTATSVIGLQFDGSQNYLSLGTMGNLGSSLGSGFYSAFTMRTTSTTNQCVISGNNTGTTTAALVFINASGGGSTSAQKIRVVLRDNSNKLIDCATTNTYNWNDGKLHTFVITADGSTNTVTVTIDGTSQDITYTTQTTPATFSNFTHAVVLGARNTAGTLSSYADVLLKSVSIGTSAGALYGVYALTANALDTSGNANNGTLTGSPPPYFLSRVVV